MCKDKVVSIITTLSSLPEDILLKIASLLQVRDVCALGCCSNFFNQFFFSDCVWHPILTNRWPLLHSSLFLYPKTWKILYFERLTELGLRAASVETFLKASTHRQSLEVGDYLKAFETINAARFAFEDVQIFMFKPQINVMLNLLAVHYCMSILGIRGENLAETLRTCEISHRQVCVKWWKVLGRTAYGYRRRDESHIRWISLGDFAIEDDEPLLGVLRRGTIHEVLRVQISSGHHPIPSSFEFIRQ